MPAKRFLSGWGVTTAALVLLFAVSACHGGFTAPCSEGWLKTERKLDPNQVSDLSECQAKLLGDLPTNNILLGGKGDSSLFNDIELGDGQDGCTDSTECMQTCQALCCLIPDCNYALINRDQDKKCEVDCSIYKETVTEWKCRMYFSGTDKKSDDNSFCDPAGQKEATCEKLAATGLGLTTQEFKDMQSAYYVPISECGARRKLLAKSGSITNPDDVKKSLKKFRRSTKSIRDGFKKARKEAGGKKNLMKNMCNTMSCSS